MSTYPNQMPEPAWRVAALLMSMLVGTPVAALDYQVHGFASQGFAWSEGNNAFGNSRSGSFKLYEAGLNGSLVVRPDLLASAQVLVRDAGATDNQGLRLDYALLDYQFLATAEANAGIRLGRVKNSFGLFNESRDVVFTRPGITLPQSIYLDSYGFRRILFASDGAQLYGGLAHGDQYSSLSVASSVNRSLSKDEKELLLPPGVTGDINVDNFLVARLQNETNGGTWRYGLSYLQATLDLQADPGIPFDANLDLQLYVLSLRHDGERYALSAEYELMSSRGKVSGAPDINSRGDGGYVQLDYRLRPGWTLYGRYDASFADWSDRDGREYAATTGSDRHGRFTRDLMLGLNWKPDAHWGVWAELHHIDGTSSLSPSDNRGRPPEDQWNLFMLMASYRF